MIKPKIFIGSSTESLHLAYALQKSLRRDAEVTVWTQNAFDLGTNVLDGLLERLNQTDFGVFVFAPDDRTTSRDKDYLSVRDNVLFEYGLFVGRIGRSRSIYMRPDKLEGFWIPADLGGVVSAPYDAAEKNAQTAVRPACKAMRRKIKELGVRASRFRHQLPQDARSTRCGALAGSWTGIAEQRKAPKGYHASGSVTFNFTPTFEGLVGDGVFDFPGFAHSWLPVQDGSSQSE